MCSGSILAVRLRMDAYGTAFGSTKYFVHVQNNFHRPSDCGVHVWEIFGKHSRSIPHVRKTSGKHASCSWCIRNEVFGLFGKHSETKLKIFGKQTETIR